MLYFGVNALLDNLLNSLEVAFEMKGESGLLEIADVETGKVFWSDAWEGEIGKTSAPPLGNYLFQHQLFYLIFTLP